MNNHKGRKVGSKSKRTIEFLTEYERLAELHGNPVEVLFKMMVNPRAAHNIKVQSASKLIEYRFPRPKPLEDDKQQGNLELVWSEGEELSKQQA